MATTRSAPISRSCLTAAAAITGGAAKLIASPGDDSVAVSGVEHAEEAELVAADLDHLQVDAADGRRLPSAPSTLVPSQG